ncbi:MAG: beta-galactosidase [Clostridia bacterium]|nr:beta-galactosidase [Clostridia bacterium]
MERLIKIGKIIPKSSYEVAESRIGIGFEKLDRDVFDPNKAYDKVARIGVKKVRIQSGWMKTEKQKGVYDFAWLDRIVSELLSRKLQPWLCLCYGNPLYTELAKSVYGAVGCPPVQSEEEMQAWLRYVDATVRHFEGRIELFEIWNEPDCAYSWKHHENETRDLMKNAYEYGVFARETAKVIKAANPSAKTCGFASVGVGDLAFVNRALSTGLGEYLDYASYHCYSTFDGDRLRTIQNYRDILDLYNPNIKIIQGESGAQSDSRGSGAMAHFAWNRDKQTKLMLRMLVQDLYAGVEFTSYFSTMDMIEALNGRVGDRASYLDYGYFGVISADFDEDGRATGEYSEKKSYYALSTLASLFAGDVQPKHVPVAREYLPSIRVNGTDCSDNTVLDYCFALDNGDTALVYWNSTPVLTTTYEGTVTYSVYGQKNDTVRLVDLATGEVYKLPDGMVEDRMNGGIRLKNLPLTDSPLMILFGSNTEIESV